MVETTEEKSETEMFSEFYFSVNEEYPDEARIQLFEKALKELQNEAD